MSDFNFYFDPENFGMGLLAGWGSAYALYRARHVISAAQQSVFRQASSAQEYAARSADARYITDLIKYCESSHLVGNNVKLSEMLVEPRFIPVPDLAAPPEDDVLNSVFHVIPNIPDHPFLQAPYNIETLSINDLDNGERAIALLGLPGSGRTTALKAIALWGLNRVKFDPPKDKVQERLEEEDNKVDDSEERANRIRDRVNVEEMVKLRLEGQKDGDSKDTDKKPQATLFRQMTPIYAHLGNLSLDIAEFGRRVDPAEPLLRAVQHHVTRVTRQTLARNFYERLNEGKALLLIDGLDDLPERSQPRILGWLKAFIEQYKHNFIIVVGPASGYGKLVQTGLAPVFLRPWNDIVVNNYVDIWDQSWSKISGSGTRRRTVKETPQEVIDSAKRDNRSRSAFDLTAKMWGAFSDAEDANYESWIRTMIAQYLPNESFGVILPKLTLAASLELDTGFISAEAMEQYAAGQPIMQPNIEDAVFDDLDGNSDLSLPEDNENPFEDDDLEGEDPFANELNNPDDEDVDSLFDEAEDDISQSVVQQEAKNKPEKPTKQKSQPKSKSSGKAAKEYTRLIAALHKGGLLVQYRNGNYQFRHKLITAYLGSLALREMSSEQCLDKLDQPAWHNAFMYLSLHTPVDTFVEQKLSVDADVLHTQIFDLAPWLAFSGDRAEWKSNIVKQLGSILAAPNQFKPVRERAAAALVSTREKNAWNVFRKLIKHPNPDVRRLSCLGAGALGFDVAVSDIASLLDDEELDVRLAAGLALGAIGSEDALEQMAMTLSDGDEIIRRAIAEAFAAIPDEGYPVLYEAVTHENMLLRRAAVFGLRRINTSWALISLFRAATEDKESYVRLTADLALEEIQKRAVAQRVQAYPNEDAIPWVRDWIMKLPPAEIQEMQGGGDLLQKAYEDGDPLLMQLALMNMGQLGMTHHLDILYMALRNRNPAVREAAYRALGDLQLQIGEALPSPSY